MSLMQAVSNSNTLYHTVCEIQASIADLLAIKVFLVALAHGYCIVCCSELADAQEKLHSAVPNPDLPPYAGMQRVIIARYCRPHPSNMNDGMRSALASPDDRKQICIYVEGRALERQSRCPTLSAM